MFVACHVRKERYRIIPTKATPREFINIINVTLTQWALGSVSKIFIGLSAPDLNRDWR